MDIPKFINSFHFNYKFIFNHYVNPVAYIHLYFLINQWQGLFFFYK